MLFYKRKRHKKHKENAYKIALKKRCNLNEKEYNDLVFKLLSKSNNNILFK